MPLQKLQFRPGINREGTTLSNEGGWYEGDKVRFRSGYPEKIGGWQRDGGAQTTGAVPTSGSFWGAARSMWAWLTLAGYNMLGLGTSKKFYVQNSVGGSLNDITPIRLTTAAGAATFAATNGSSTLTVTCAGHGAQVGDFVTFSGAVSLGGNITAAVLNREFVVVTVPSTNTFTVTASATATGADSGNGGAAVVAAFQLTTGSDAYTVGTGWSAAGWGGISSSGNTGWGSPATSGVGLQLRLWSQANYGQDLIINPRDGGLYYWAVNANPNSYDRAQKMTAGSTVTTVYGSSVMESTAPSVAKFVMVSDSSRFVVAFGTNDPTGVYATTAQDPMQIRWSDQERFNVWTPAVTNQAGDYRLSHGSKIMTAMQTRQEVLVWTDAALYSMQYLGPPYVWGFQILGDNISLAGPNATAVVNNVAYWMGYDKFYTYSGRVETLPCTLRQEVFGNINMDQAYQFVAGTNEGYNEVWWFYCSAGSTQNDRYVVFNHLERIWYYGTLDRTFWLDSPLRSTPIAATSSNNLVYHEVGTDNMETTTPQAINSYLQSADFDIGDGHNFGFVWRIIPDVSFDGSTVDAPSVDFTVRPRRNPGAKYGTADAPAVTSANNYAGQRTYPVQLFTEQVYVRIRGRQMAFKISSDTLGVQWSLGSPRIDVQPDGRK